MSSRLALAESPVSKPERHHTRNEIHEVGIKDRSQAGDGDDIFENYCASNCPNYRQELDDFGGECRSHRTRHLSHPLKAFANRGSLLLVSGNNLGNVGFDNRGYEVMVLNFALRLG